jgi:hypothetical protein
MKQTVLHEFQLIHLHTKKDKNAPKSDKNAPKFFLKQNNQILNFGVSKYGFLVKGTQSQSH